LGKRNNPFIKQQSSKNIPRIGRRSDLSAANVVDDTKCFSHVQPLNPKFLTDFFTNNMICDEQDLDLKFVSWDELDKALELDKQLKTKLMKIAFNGELDDLKKKIFKTNSDSSNTAQPLSSQDYFQEFVPYDAENKYKYRNMENDAYFYRNTKQDNQQI
jgi:hypothetical protein